MIMFDHTFSAFKKNPRLLFYKAHGTPNEYSIHLNRNRSFYVTQRAKVLQDIFQIKPEIVDWFQENNISYQKYEVVFRYFSIRETQRYRVEIMSYFDCILQLESANDLMRFKLAWA